MKVLNMDKEYDFSKAKRANNVPHLATLQAEAKGKTRITIMLDNEVLESFRQQAKLEGLGYQTLINQALRSYMHPQAMDEATLRKVVREEIAYCIKNTE